MSIASVLCGTSSSEPCNVWPFRWEITSLLSTVWLRIRAYLLFFRYLPAHGPADYH